MRRKSCYLRFLAFSGEAGNGEVPGGSLEHSGAISLLSLLLLFMRV